MSVVGVNGCTLMSVVGVVCVGGVHYTQERGAPTSVSVRDGGCGWAYTHGCVSVDGCSPTNMSVDGYDFIRVWMGVV